MSWVSVVARRANAFLRLSLTNALQERKAHHASSYVTQPSRYRTTVRKQRVQIHAGVVEVRQVL